MMADTSLDAYQGIMKKLPKKQQETYDIIKKYPNKTAAQYAQILVKPVNSISGRFVELRRAGKITRVEKVQCPVTKGMAWTLKVVV